ncbi:MAG: HflX family GTPase [Nitrososphaeria archaeon]|nr:HflX family GTPase [Nitrososphaeria archaeon]
MLSAILITYDNEDVIREAYGLCEAAGYKVDKLIRQRYLNKSKYGIGEGKTLEIQEISDRIKPDVLIYDEFLKPSQNYNLASKLKINVLDRESLILEIFERRATSAESHLQIKLAQFRYEMSRAKEKVRLAKMGEQPGFMGIGMYEVDSYYNDIQNRIKSVKSKLEKMGKQRALHREARRRVGLKTISLAGYTSAGKTTMFNLLTGETKQESPELFTTLSTTTRKVLIDKDPVLFSDTVGFISSCLKTMADLDVNQERVIYALNKSDLVEPDEIVRKADFIGLLDSKKWVPVSAVTQQNIPKLLDLVKKMMSAPPQEIKEIPRKQDLTKFYEQDDD